MRASIGDSDKQAATTRSLERKSEGSGPDSPERQRARTEEEPPGWAKELMHGHSQLMQKMTDVGGKVDDMTMKVESAVNMADDAKKCVERVEAKVVTFQDEINDMKKTIEKDKNQREEWQSMVDGKIASVEFKDTMEDATPPDPMMQTKITEIEKTIASMKVSAQSSAAVGNIQREGQGTSTAIIGRLDKASTIEDAESWLDTQLSKYGVPKPISTFIKDDSFKGRLWARFPTAEAMNAATEMFQSKTLTHGDYGEGKVWCNKDRPHHERMSRAFLADLKKLLVNWQLNKKAVQFDEDAMILSIELKPVLQVSAQGGHLKLQWLDAKWESWQELVDSKEFKELVEKGNAALKIAQGLRNKGKGKGKPE